MTSLPPFNSDQFDKPLTLRSMRSWIGAAVLAAATAGGWILKANDALTERVVKVVAERKPHTETTERLKETAETLTQLDDEVSENSAQLRALSVKIESVDASLRVLTAAAIERAQSSPRQETAMRATATKIRAEAEKAGKDDPLAGVEGL